MANQRNFLHHLHPGRVRPHALRPTTTFGLGIACLTCAAVLVVTGLTLFPYYQGSAGAAYERILHISTALRHGTLVRSLHYHAANALVVLAWFHLVRVFLTGAYKGRRLNWFYGLGLLLIVLTANYTGYLLPWDQTAYWAAEVGARLLGYLPALGEPVRTLLLAGPRPGPDTLPRVFALHAGVLPLALALLSSLHLWRIRKDGGLASPDQSPPSIPAAPWLYRAELAVALTTLAVLLVLTTAGNAPLASRADPFHPPNPAKAPWYFVGIQEMVSHSARVGVVAVPGLFALFLVLVPVLDRSRSPGGTWLARDRRAINRIFLLVILGQLGLIVVGQWFRGANWVFQTPF